MSTTTATTPSSSTAWAARHLLSSTARSYWVSMGLRILMLIAFSCADLIFIKGTLDLILDQQEAVSWTVAIVLTIGSVAIMVKAGYLYRKAQDDGHGRGWILVLVAGWALLGVALVVMRFNGAEWTSSAIAVEGQVGAVDETAKHQGIALLLGLIYISAGVFAYFEGMHDINPTAIEYMSLRPRVARLIDDITAQRGIVARAAEDLERAKGNLAALPDARAAAEGALRYRAEELMALARVRIANALGDPAATGITEIEPNPFTAETGKDAR